MTQWLALHFTWIPYLCSILIYFIALVAEASFANLSGRNVYQAKDTASNLAMYLGSFLIDLFWMPVVYLIYVWAHSHSIWKIGSDWWLFQGDTPLWTWPLLFLLEDLCYYVFHRSSHSLRVFWASHSNHHSSNFFNLSVAARQTWTPFYSFLFWLPLLFIGFDPLLVMTQQMISLTYQSLIHTELVSRLGWLEWIFNTPSHHRVHHGTNASYLDKNFGGILIIWDRIFGTFQEESEQSIYGISPRLDSYSPLVIAFHEYKALMKDRQTYAN